MRIIQRWQDRVSATKLFLVEKMKDIFKKILLVLLGLAIGILLAFAGLEVYLKGSGNFELQRFYNPQDTERGFTHHMRYDDSYEVSEYPCLGWEKNPLYPPINSYDRFTDSLDVEKPEGVFRIIAIGDSVTEQGYYEKHLEIMLNNSDLGRKFEVWNCGIGGYSITQYYHYLRCKAIRFKPDIVIVGLNLGDLERHVVVFMTKDGYKAFKNPFTGMDISINRFLFLNSRFYRFILYNIEEVLKVKKVYGSDITLDFENIVKLTQSENVKLLVLIWPYMKNFYNDEELRTYETIKDLLERYKVSYIDLHACFDDRDLPYLRHAPDDYMHPSEEAFKIMAREIYKTMLNNLSQN